MPHGSKSPLECLPFVQGLSVQSPRVHVPLGQGPLGAGSRLGDSRGAMQVLVAPVFWGRIWWRGGQDCRDWTRVDARVLGTHRLPHLLPHLLGYQKSPRRVFPLTRLGGGIGSGAGAGLRGGAERRREGSRDLRGPRAQRRRRPCPFPGLPFSPGPLPSTSILTFSHPVRLLRPSPAASLFSHLSPLGTGEAD